MEVGDLLNEAKSRVGHGNFEAWLKDHCQLTFRTARRYMKMAKNRPLIEKQLAGKSAKVADLNAQGLLTDQSNPSSSNSGNQKNASDKYDAAQAKLIEKLQDLDVDAADAAAEATTRELKKTVATMKAGAKNKAA